MLPRPRAALIASLACFAGLALTGVVAYLVPAARLRDSASLDGFVGLGGPRANPVLDAVAHLAHPWSYALLGIGILVAALARGRMRLAVVLGIVLVASPATAETLKPLLAHSRYAEWLGSGQIAAASWPSGHATASMTLALCAVMAAPPALRPLAAVAGGLFALAVSFSILVLAWHFPSDIVGGYLCAAAWTLLAVAALRRWPDPGPARARECAGSRPTLLPAVALGAVAVGAAAGVALQRPRTLVSYVVDRPSLLVAAAAIAALAATLAVVMARGART